MTQTRNVESVAMRNALLEISLILALIAMAYLAGSYEVVRDCEKTGRYRINAEEELICGKRSVTLSNQGELNYLRPTGNKVTFMKET